MDRARPAALVLAVASAFAARPFAQPGDDPVAIVRSYFAVSDSSGRAALAARLAAHRDYRPSRLRDWIHRAAPFSPQDPGPQKLTVDIGAGESREVFLFVPAGYRPDRAWPLIYALHPSGQPAEEWGNHMQHMLGTRARKFRHLHQASCYWLEGLSWVGEQWGDPRPALLPARDGEPEAQVIARTLEPMLGRLTGEIDGQMIRVTRRHIGDVVIWLGERTIDWDRPIVVEVDGKTVFSGRVARDASVALARAAATMDFDALRFAGLCVRADGHVLVVTAATMPEAVWRTGLGR
jgi:hypothetical protein